LGVHRSGPPKFECKGMTFRLNSAAGLIDRLERIDRVATRVTSRVSLSRIQPSSITSTRSGDCAHIALGRQRRNWPSLGGSAQLNPRVTHAHAPTSDGITCPLLPRMVTGILLTSGYSQPKRSRAFEVFGLDSLEGEIRNLVTEVDRHGKPGWAQGPVMQQRESEY
jgi:hypothetical protein